MNHKGVRTLNKLRKLFLWENQKGSFSIEAIIAMTGVLMVTFLGIAYFTYLVPRQMLTQEVHLLAQTAKIQGGLTDENSEPGSSDVERFLESMEAKGFDPSKVVIIATATAKDKTQRSVLGVEPLETGYVNDKNKPNHYSHRNSKEVIKIDVYIPAKMEFINAMSQYFADKDSGLHGYHFTETIMSERW